MKQAFDYESGCFFSGYCVRNEIIEFGYCLGFIALIILVKGTSLEGKLTHMPEDYAGKPVVLIIGYLQKSQFDIDRWIYGILENNIGIRVVEVPTLPGLVPGMISNIIDNGMRGRIPKEDWGGVVTVYDDASKIVDAIGNDNPQNGHVVLLGSDGRILWLHDRGFSPRILLDLKKRIAELPPGA